MQSIRFILGTIVTMVVLAWTGVQLYAAYTVSSAMYQVNSSIDEAERASQPPVGTYQVENVKGDQALWPGYEALSKITEPVDDRVITFNAYVKLREFLKPGEERPDADFADVFVNARASAFADGECARVLKKLASQCLVRHVNAYRVDKEDGLYNIQATLAFVQKDGLGNVEAGTRLAYREVSKGLADGGKAVTVMPDDAARQREKFYEETVRICVKLRKAEGNCAIYRIQISANDKPGSDALQLSGDAQFSFLQPLKA